MAKFKSNNTYLCKRLTDARWYIVHQAGQRSWTATVFTHVQGLDDDDTHLTMNGTALYLQFALGEILPFNKSVKGDEAKMREKMFNILKWGQEDEPKEDEPKEDDKEIP